MSDQPQFDFGPDDELEEEREQSGEEWAEDASDVLGNNPLGKAAGTGRKCTVCYSGELHALGQEGRPQGEVPHRVLPLLLRCACLS